MNAVLMHDKEATVHGYYCKTVPLIIYVNFGILEMAASTFLSCTLNNIIICNIKINYLYLQQLHIYYKFDKYVVSLQIFV
jgi:hypothetical protein